MEPELLVLPSDPMPEAGCTGPSRSSPCSSGTESILGCALGGLGDASDHPLAMPSVGARRCFVGRREETVVFVRVVRFTDVTAERVESLVSGIDDTGPPGVSIKKLQLVFDETQGTAVRPWA
jgi:hypothetical protein